MSATKAIRVSCALIEREGAVLACQRSSAMTFALKWEFPGGKIEPGESAEQCLSRELMEEIGVRVAIISPLSEVTHHYEGVTVTLYPFLCSILSGEPVLHEHAASLWLPPQELTRLDWCEADLPIIREYLERFPR